MKGIVSEFTMFSIQIKPQRSGVFTELKRKFTMFSIQIKPQLEEFV